MIITAEVSELTRKIKLPTDRVLSVDGDYQVDGIAFKLPATYEGDFDFSTAAARVHWTGVDKVEHTNLITEEDGNGYPLWVMPSELTQGGHGVIEFAVSFVATDETAAITKRWISDPVSFRNRRTVNGSNEDEEAEEETTYDRLASAIAAVRAAQAEVEDTNAVLSSLSGSAPVPVENRSDMVDNGHLYLYTGDETGLVTGNLYYYVNGTLTNGGQYGSMEVDATLTESGKAADAAAVGAEVSAIKEDLSDMADIVPIEGYVIGKALDTSVNPVKTTKPVTNAECRHVVVDCKPGDRFIINAVGASSARAWCFVNSNDYLIGVSEVNATVSNLVLTAPYDAAKLIINDKYTDPPLISYKGYKRDEEVAEIKKSQEVISFEEEYFDKVLIKGNLVDTSVTGLYGGTQGYPSYIYLPHPGDGEYFKNPFTTVNQQLHIAFIGSGDDPLSITNKTAGNTVDHWELNSGLYKWVFEETAITLYKYSSMANYNAGNAESINEYELAEIPVKWRISGRWWPSNKQLGITTYPSATYVPVGDHYEYRLKWKPITVDNLALLFEILRNVVYTSDQRDNIDALYDALSVRGE